MKEKAIIRKQNTCIYQCSSIYLYVFDITRISTHKLALKTKALVLKKMFYLMELLATER